MAKKGKKKSKKGFDRQNRELAERTIEYPDKYDVQNMEIIVRSLEQENVMLREHICHLETMLAKIRGIVT